MFNLTKLRKIYNKDNIQFFNKIKKGEEKIFPFLNKIELTINYYLSKVILLDITSFSVVNLRIYTPEAVSLPIASCPFHTEL